MVWSSAVAGPWRPGRHRTANKIDCGDTILIILRDRATAGPERALVPI
jgi:hypothetical protein